MERFQMEERVKQQKCKLSVALLVILVLLALAVYNLVLSINKRTESESEQQLKIPPYCHNGTTLYPNDAAFYNPDFIQYNSDSLERVMEIHKSSMELSEVFEHFGAFIFDCVLDHDRNYTEYTVKLLSALAKAKSESKDFTPEVWIRIPSLAMNIAIDNWSACVKLATDTNRKHPGTIQGFVISDKAIMELASHLEATGPNLPSGVLKGLWYAHANSTLQMWERHGLLTGLLLSSSYCTTLKNHVPKEFIQSVDTIFYLENSPSQSIAENGSPFLKVSENFGVCHEYLAARFDFKLTLPKNVFPTIDVSQPYCLLR